MTRHDDSTQEESWLEYNDSKVKEFSKKSIESECFGGATEGGSDNMWNLWRDRDNSKNAYLLVYERRTKDPLRMEFKD